MIFHLDIIKKLLKKSFTEALFDSEYFLKVL